MDSNRPTSLYTKQIRTLLIALLRICGLWKPYEKSIWLQTVYSTYSVVFLTTFVMIYTAAMVINIFVPSEADDSLANRLFLSLTEAALLVKVINFFFNNRDWQRIFDEIDEFRTNASKEEIIIQFRTRIFLILTLAYLCSVHLSVYASVMIPLLDGGKNLPFSGWYPGFEWKYNQRDYWIVYIYQSFGSFITANLNVGIDAYYYFVILILSAQVNIYGNRLRSLQFDEMKDSIEKSRFKLIQQLHTHQRLNSTFDLIQRNLQWTYFAQILMSSIVICSVITELAEVNMKWILRAYFIAFFYRMPFHSIYLILF